VDAACPLCGAPLHPQQEWCLNCGAAARTRLAAPTNWKAPIVAIAVIVTLALGVLAAALVKLSGGSGTAQAPLPVTRTITTAAPVLPGAIPTTTTGATGATGVGGAVAPTTTGAVTPGAPTTISPSTPTTTAAPTTTTTPTTTIPTNTGGGNPHAAEEALRKAGFLPRSKK
jgi:hypothetical protein